MSQRYLISLALLVQMALYVCPSIGVAQEQKLTTPSQDISTDRRVLSVSYEALCKTLQWTTSTSTIGSWAYFESWTSNSPGSQSRETNLRK